MLDYEWGSPSTIILAGNEGGVGGGEPDQTRRQIFDHNFTMLTDNNNHHNNSNNNNILHGSAAPISTTNGFFSHHHHFNFNNPPQQQHHAFFDPRAFQDASASTTSFSPPPPPPSMLSLNSIPPLATSHFGLGPGPGLGFLLMPKSEDVIMSNNFEGSGHVLGPGLGLNLGGRTYFPSCNDDTAGGRLYRNTKAAVHTTVSSNLPRCQAEGCNADLSDAKHYHRRHKVCEYHSKAATVVTAGLTQRFCQQCSRFHLLSEFDNGKRSCRKRLADHNRRRRKTQQIAQEIHKSSLDNVVAKSSSESRAQSSPPLKVTAVLSPPDYFRQQIVANQNRGGSSSSTASAGSLFFSSG